MGVQVSCQTPPVPPPRQKRKSKASLVASSSHKDFFGPERWSSKILSRDSQESTIDETLREEELNTPRPSLEGIEDDDSENSEETEKERWVIVDEIDDDTINDDEEYSPPRKTMRLDDDDDDNDNDDDDEEDTIEQIPRDRMLLLEKEHSLDSVEEEEFRQSITRAPRYTPYYAPSSGVAFSRTQYPNNERYDNFEKRSNWLMDNTRRTNQDFKTEEMPFYSRNNMNRNYIRNEEYPPRSYMDYEDEQHLPSLRNTWENNRNNSKGKSYFSLNNTERKKCYWIIGNDGRISKYSEIEETPESTNVENIEPPRKSRYITLNKKENSDVNVNNYSRSIIKRFDTDKEKQEKFRRSTKNVQERKSGGQNNTSMLRKSTKVYSKQSIKPIKENMKIDNKNSEKPAKFRYLLLNKQDSDVVNEDYINEDRQTVDEDIKRKTMYNWLMKKNRQQNITDNEDYEEQYQPSRATMKNINTRKTLQSMRSEEMPRMSRKSTRKSFDMNSNYDNEEEDEDEEDFRPNTKKKTFFGCLKGEEQRENSYEWENDESNEEMPRISRKSMNQSRMTYEQNRVSRASTIRDNEMYKPRLSKGRAKSIRETRNSIDNSRRDSEIEENQSKSCWSSRNKRYENNDSDEEQYTLSGSDMRRRRTSLKSRNNNDSDQEQYTLSGSNARRRTSLKSRSNNDSDQEQYISSSSNRRRTSLKSRSDNDSDQEQYNLSGSNTRRRTSLKSRSNNDSDQEQYTLSGSDMRRRTSLKPYGKSIRESERQEKRSSIKGYERQDSEDKKRKSMFDLLIIKKRKNEKKEDNRTSRRSTKRNISTNRSRSKQESMRGSSKSSPSKSRFRWLLLSKEKSDEDKINSSPTERHSKYRYMIGKNTGRTYQDSIKEEQRRLLRGIKIKK